MLSLGANPCLLTHTCPDEAWKTMRRCAAKSFTVGEIREDFEVAKVSMHSLLLEHALVCLEICYLGEIQQP